MNLLKIVFILVTLLFFPIQSEDNQYVLVTGGAGYIGSHTCKALKEAGFIPVSYDSLVVGDQTMVKWGPLVIADLLDEDALDAVFNEYKPIAVIHFAAFRNVRESVQYPHLYYTNNVSGSIQLLNAIIKHKIKHLIFSSSCTVYGECSSSLISEECSKNPVNPYARSKYMVEMMIKDYALEGMFDYMILRYFNAAGVDVNGGLKRHVNSFNFLIPQALLTAVSPGLRMQLFGKNYDTPDGTAIRDYVHVKDLADAHVVALRHLLENKGSNEINLGSGKGYSVLEIVHEVEKITGKIVPYDVKPAGTGELSKTVAEIRKAKEVLNFETKYSNLHDIIQSEWDSMQKEKVK